MAQPSQKYKLTHVPDPFNSTIERRRTSPRLSMDPRTKMGPEIAYNSELFGRFYHDEVFLWLYFSYIVTARSNACLGPLFVAIKTKVSVQPERRIHMICVHFIKFSIKRCTWYLCPVYAVGHSFTAYSMQCTLS